MYTTEQIRDKSPISYSQVPPPAIYNDPPQLYPYRQPPPTQIHNHYQPPYSPCGQPPQPQIHNQPLYSPYGQPPPPQIHNQPPYSHGQATFQHHPVTIGVVHVVNMRDPNNPANSKYPVRMKCPACGENITTVTKHVTDCDSYIKAIVLLLVG
ncbi:unnamed protein product [Mytilus edulis]|uniref:LITAF domain-containing protein n=1 Tax=Mytilus edulis TaxID=6550 RepID=A0A8S3RVQ7_MYTED|nr:unnamed protein product [Mytilus edulis]